jgi:hypothetical protein
MPLFEIPFIKENIHLIKSIGYPILGIFSVFIVLTIGYYFYEYFIDRKN